MKLHFFKHTHLFYELVQLLIVGCIFAATTSNAEDTCSTLIELPPRGISCLHCLYTPVHDGVDLLTDAILKSCLKNVAIAFLVDGSFGQDFTTIETQTKKLLDAGRTVHIHIYLLSGPAQRLWWDKTFSGFGNNIAPGSFRRKLLKNRSFQRSYKGHVLKVKPTIQSIVAEGAIVSVCPMLEDNLNNSTFSKIVTLTQEVLSDVTNISYVRSPCPHCFAGNQVDVPEGIISEQHLSSSSFSQQGGIISNDGWAFVSMITDPQPSQSVVKMGDKEQVAIRLEDLSSVRDQATVQQNTFLLWIAKYQGTVVGETKLPVSKRTFAIPSEEDATEIATFLSGQ